MRRLHALLDEIIQQSKHIYQMQKKECGTFIAVLCLLLLWLIISLPLILCVELFILFLGIIIKFFPEVGTIIGSILTLLILYYCSRPTPIPAVPTQDWLYFAGEYVLPAIFKNGIITNLSKIDPAMDYYKTDVFGYELGQITVSERQKIRRYVIRNIAISYKLQDIAIPFDVSINGTLLIISMKQYRISDVPAKQEQSDSIE